MRAHHVVAALVASAALLLAIDAAVSLPPALRPGTGLEAVRPLARAVGSALLAIEAALLVALHRPPRLHRTAARVGRVAIAALLGAQALLGIALAFSPDIPPSAPSYQHYLTALNFATVPLTWDLAPLAAPVGAAMGAVAGAALEARRARQG